MKRCSRCILPETFPNVKYNEDGVCNVCLDYDNKWSQWKKVGYNKTRLKLEYIFKKIKSLNKEYDCIVPLSGGKDSIYTLYLCKKVWSLKVLAVNFDNGFQTDEAIKNIANAVNILDVDLLVFKPGWGLMKRLYSCFLLKAGEFCSPCNAGITLSMNRVAQEKSIPLILFGNSPRTDESSPKDIYFCSSPYFLRVVKENGLQDMIRGTIYQDAYKLSSLSFRIRRKMNKIILMEKFSKILPNKLNFITNSTPISINLPEYIEWNENELFDVIKKELKWEKSAVGKEHGDCKLDPVKCYLRQQRWGFGSKTQKLSALVRDGQMRRDTALDLTKGEDLEPEELSYLLSSLDLNRNYLAEIRESYHIKYL